MASAMMWEACLELMSTLEPGTWSRQSWSSGAQTTAACTLSLALKMLAESTPSAVLMMLMSLEFMLLALSIHRRSVWEGLPMAQAMSLFFRSATVSMSWVTTMASPPRDQSVCMMMTGSSLAMPPASTGKLSTVQYQASNWPACQACLPASKLSLCTNSTWSPEDLAKSESALALNP